ncbi:MAG: hotdog fold thioesterase [Rhodospirillales bacterium]|nr:hotdog fold thioesterase [Rhodospirillales bacterium]
MQNNRAQRAAEAVVKAMLLGDKVAVWLGAELLEVSPGRVKLQMTVRDDMLNAVNIGHGGVSFSFADVAFALACNSHNDTMVAQTCNISFMGPAKLGDVLTVTCEETLLEGRTGIYDAIITNQNGDKITIFRGQSRGIPGQILPDLDI